MSAGDHQAVSKKRLGWPGASRQIQDRSEMPACARIRRIPGCLPVASTAWRPSAGMPRPACTSTGRRRSSASANTGREVRVVERELLRARMELDAARAAVERPLRLRDRVAVRVEAAEREQPSVGRGGLRDDHVVCLRVPVRLVHRKDECARVDPPQRGEELLARAPVAVRVVRADVGMGVERLELADLGAEQLEPRHHAGVVDHVAETTKSRAGNAKARRSRGRA